MCLKHVGCDSVAVISVPSSAEFGNNSQFAFVLFKIVLETFYAEYARTDLRVANYGDFAVVTCYLYHTLGSKLAALVVIASDV